MLKRYQNLIFLVVAGLVSSTGFADDETQDEVTITADPGLGVLTIKGSHDAVRKTQGIIKKLEHRKEMVSISVTFAVSDTETGKNKIVDEIKLSALDGTKASVSFGQEIAVVAGRTQSRTGSQNYFQSKQVGTIVKVIPEVTARGIILELMAEKSWMDAAKVSDEAESNIPPPTYSADCETTIELAAGESQTLQALVSGGTDSGRVMLITVSASTNNQLQQRSIERRSPPAQNMDASKRTEVEDKERGDRPARPSREPSRSRSGASRGGSRSSGDSGSSREREEVRANAVEKIVARVFDQFDKNSDGQLDAEEIARLPRSLQENVTEPNQTRDEFEESFTMYLEKRDD